MSPSDETTGARSRRPLEAEQQRLDAGLDLARVERPRDDVVGTGLEEADALLDVVAGGDAQDGDGRHRRCGPDLAAQLDAALALGRCGPDIDDGELVVDHLLDRFVGVGGTGDGVPGGGEDRTE